MISVSKFFFPAVLCLIALPFLTFAQTYPVVGTGQVKYYNLSNEIAAPAQGAAFYGQDAQYPGNVPAYVNNGDGTVTDLVTGLMWQASADINNDGLINVSDKLSQANFPLYADSLTLGGYTDWRMPTIKELYSLILFSGMDVSGPTPSVYIPFLDTNYFEFAYGDLAAGERLIDAQYATATMYVSTTMGGDQTVFGVNFADGRIKGYGITMPDNSVKLFNVKCVRGIDTYGINDFEDLGNGTVTDHATGLTWMKDDNGQGITWEAALSYAEGVEFAGFTDWRLPDAKELHTILDYTRSPATDGTAAIDPLLNCSSITDEGGDSDFPFYWTSTTHASTATSPGGFAAYLCFGTALGWMELPPSSGTYVLMDVHGAGAQRSDPKQGNPALYPHGNGPQGDVVRINNYVRLVRGGTTQGIDFPSTGSLRLWPNPSRGPVEMVLPKGAQWVRAYDCAGRLIMEKLVDTLPTTSVDLPADGLYLIQVETPGRSYSQKVITRTAD